jgi:hypothetical protein
MHSRKWLLDELALHHKAVDHCWKTLNPFGHSCIAYMTTAHDLFKESKNKEDLALWKMTVDRSEEYVKEKYAKYYSVLKRIRYPEADVTSSHASKDEDHAKTKEHMDYIAAQRVLISNGEELLKNIELQRLTAIVESNKTDYERTGNKDELKTWKASLNVAIQYLKDIKWNKNFLGLQIDAYNLAEKEYNKQHSCISRYFFWCCADSVDVLERDEDRQVNDSNRTPYMRLPGP